MKTNSSMEQQQNTAAASALSAHGLSCVRGGKMVFSSLDFTVATGSVLLLRGANGSGKSSLLQILAGLLVAEAGRILSFGNAASGGNYLRGLRYIGHGNGIKEQLTAEENLLFYKKFRGWDALMPHLVLQRVALAGQAKLLAGDLSSGQQRRLALARLLLAPAALWLLDEPCTGLDKNAGTWFAAALRSHCTAGGAAVIAQHGSAIDAGIPTAELVLA